LPQTNPSRHEDYRTAISDRGPDREEGASTSDDLGRSRRFRERKFRHQSNLKRRWTKLGLGCLPTCPEERARSRHHGQLGERPAKQRRRIMSLAAWTRTRARPRFVRVSANRRIAGSRRCFVTKRRKSDTGQRGTTTQSETSSGCRWAKKNCGYEPLPPQKQSFERASCDDRASRGSAEPPFRSNTQVRRLLCSR